MKYSTIEDRFWSKVVKDTGCWEWRDSLNNKGYGQFGMNGTMRIASRVAYELTYGFIPMGMSVLHHCDNSKCCRPDHLFLGTQADNQQDMKRKGRSTRGERDGQTKLVAEQIQSIRKEYTEGKSIAQLAREYRVCRAQIRRILTGERWGHIPIDKAQRMPQNYYSNEHRYPPELEEKVCNSIKSGISYRETARIYGVSMSTICDWCKKANISSPKRKKHFTRQQKQLIRQSLQIGKPIHQIAKELQCDGTAITYWAKLWDGEGIAKRGKERAYVEQT